MDNLDFDLVAQVERDLRQPGKRSGKWVFFFCPFHNDRHPTNFAVCNSNGSYSKAHWQCFACNRKGGPIDWFMEYHNMSYQDALSCYRGNAQPAERLVEPIPPPPDNPPGPKWQARAWQIIQRAEAALWNEKGAWQALEWSDRDPKTGEADTLKASPLDWLMGRGLCEQTIKFWHIGYIPLDWEDNPQHWGLEGRPVKMPQGILIPCFIGNEVWYLKTRRPMGSPKYIQVRGSRPALYMVQALEFQDVAIFCEGELDALLLWQEAGDMSGVVTLGSATNELNIATWSLYLLHSKHRFTAYDLDKAGEAGAAKLDWLHPKRLAIPRIKPRDKDLTDYFRSGGDLRELVKAELNKLGIPAPKSKAL